MPDQLRANLTFYEDCSTSYSFVAATDFTSASARIAAKDGFTIFIAKIAYMPTTLNAAVQTFQDSASTPIIAARSIASAPIGTPVLFDFGPNGFQLTEGKSLDHLMSATGGAGSVTITAYYKRTTGKQVPL